MIDDASLLVAGNVHGCLRSLISSFRLHQIGNAAEGKINRMLSKLSVIWCELRCSKCFGVIRKCCGFARLAFLRRLNFTRETAKVNVLRDLSRSGF